MLNWPWCDALITAMACASQRGVSITFFPGNRDFLLGPNFAKRCGASWRKDPCVIDCYGRNTLLMHGDVLCAQDRTYQRFRRIIQHAFTQKAFLLLPWSLRYKIGGSLRRISHAQNSMKSISLMDVDSVAVAECMAKYHVTQLIHGHTHRPAIHESDAGRRLVLPDWHSGVKIMQYLPNHHWVECIL